jgi:hypothetical protein
MVRIPDDEDQLREALDQGILDETHTLDFKSALPNGRGRTRSSPATSPSSPSTAACS